MHLWNVAHYWECSSYWLPSSVAVHWMLKTYFSDQSRNVLEPNKLNSDTDFPCASQHRKEGALAVTHSHLLHTHNGEIGHGVLLFHMAVGSVFFMSLCDITGGCCVSFYNCGGGMTSVLGLWSKMGQFCFNAMLWLPGYFSSMKIKKEFGPLCSDSKRKSHSGGCLKITLTMLIGQNVPGACGLQWPDLLCVAFIFHRPCAVNGLPASHCS